MLYAGSIFVLLVLQAAFVPFALGSIAPLLTWPNVGMNAVYWIAKSVIAQKHVKPASEFSLSTNAKSCDLACPPGSYPDIANLVCKTCTSSILNCAICFSSNNTLICSACYDLYYLTSNGVCKLCSNVLNNCLLCLNPTNCISCSSGFNLVYLNSQYQCVLPYTCNVSNCQICNSNNQYLCTTCEIGYYLTNNNLNCTLITCVTTQYYDPESGTCKCRAGTYVLNNICIYCNLDNCVSCNTGGCITCKPARQGTMPIVVSATPVWAPVSIAKQTKLVLNVIMAFRIQMVYVYPRRKQMVRLKLNLMMPIVQR